MTDTTIAPKVTPGQNVTYVGTKGHPKAAFVVNTPDTLDEGTSLPALSEGQVHLVVWDWSAMHFTPRMNVPFEGIVADNTEFNGEDGQTVGAWKLA